MTDDRDSLPADERADDPDGQTALAVPRLLCEAFLEELPVTSVAISVFDAEGRQSTICVSDPIAERLDEIQLELGIGPNWDALRTSRPVLVPDLGIANPPWPMFTVAATDLGVRAIFAFPMFLGAVTVGVVALAALVTTTMHAHEIATAVKLTSGISRQAVWQAIASAEDPGHQGSTTPLMRREVHQATGMVLAQLDITATEAFLRLRAHAFATEQTLQDVAHAVVTRRLDFRDLES